MAQALKAQDVAAHGLNAQAALDVKNIHLRLGSGAARVHILKGIDLEIAAGSSVGISGASGSGKSTLLAVMAGLEQPGSGEVYINGERTTHYSEDRLAKFRGRHIGIVFQSFHLIPTMTALENVAVPLELAGDAAAFEKAAAELRAVGLGERLHHYPSQLSGGEQQRVAIARALAPSPALLFADEPTGNLDEATGAEIIELLFARQKTSGATLIIITHDSALAARCQRQLKIRSGEIVSDSAIAPVAA